MNRQFSVLSSCNFTRNNPQIAYILVALKTENVGKIKKTLKTRFYEKMHKTFLHLYLELIHIPFQLRQKLRLEYMAIIAMYCHLGRPTR